LKNTPKKELGVQKHLEESTVEAIDKRLEKEAEDQNHPEKGGLEKSEPERTVVDFPIEVPAYRFDQKNDVFKRARWDRELIPYMERYIKTVKFKDKAGFRKLDYAFRWAAQHVEHEFAKGGFGGNYGLYSWDNDNIAEIVKRHREAEGPVEESPEEMSRIIKKAAMFYGADLVGICKVHPNLIYSKGFNPLTLEHYPIDLPEDCRHAVVVAIAMDYDAVRYSPNGISGATTGVGYSKMAFVANLVATFIRGLGYKAIPCGNDTAPSISLAIAAGLGELGRMGILVTKKYGPRVRLFKVFTDLPLKVDDYRPFGVEAFCKVCKKCAIHCPSQSISHGDQTIDGHSISSYSGVLKWYIQPEKCFKFWSKNRMTCSNCIRTCPFNKPVGGIHNMVRYSIRTMPLFNRFIVWADDLLGYGRSMQKREYW